MPAESKALDFFLGSNTPLGFVSKYAELSDTNRIERLFCVKGGPGTGKSGMMKTVAQKFAGDSMELIHCASDADSLDAVILHDRKIAIADATLPHAIEPRYPGAFESTVFLNDCWDEAYLFDNRREIIGLVRENGACHERCRRLLSSAGALLNDTYWMAREITNERKVIKRAEAVYRRNVGKPQAKGGERVRLLSAITNKGPVCFESTAQTLCEKIVFLEDSFGAASRIFMNRIREMANAEGHSLVTCFCPMAPFDKIDHLFFPELGAGFMVNSCYHKLLLPPSRRIYAAAFTDKEKLNLLKPAAAKNKKAVRQLLAEASGCLRQAKAVHDKLEEFYIAATDFKKVDKKTDELIAKLK